jgi:uncharacterized protein (TIGR02246 family)
MFSFKTITPAIILALISFSSVQAVQTDQAKISHPVIEQVFAKYEKAFNAGDAKAIIALWQKDGEFVDPLGNRIVGTESIEKLFQDFFARNPGKKLTLNLLSLKEQEQGRVVVAEVVPEINPPLPNETGKNKATIVLVRSGEKWLIEGVKETPHLPASYEHLKALQWLVGSWTTKDGSNIEQEKTNPISINSSCQWTANKSFLTRTFNTRMQLLELNGTEVIGWDPQTKTIRSWLFESTGGFTESTWKPDGKKWIIEMKGVLASGEAVSSTTTVTPVDENTISLESQKRMRGGKQMPEIAPLSLHRVTESVSATPAP